EPPVGGADLERVAGTDRAVRDHRRVEIERDVAIAVLVDRVGDDLLLADPGSREIERRERARVDRLTGLIEAGAEGEVRRHRREQVPAMESRRDGFEPEG